MFYYTRHRKELNILISKLYEWAHEESGRVGLIAETLGVTREYASMLVNGRHRITSKRVKQLMTLTGLSLRELNAELADELGV